MPTPTGNEVLPDDFQHMQQACSRGRLELDMWLLPLQEQWHTFTVDMKRKAWFLLDACDEELWLIFLEHPNVIEFLNTYLLGTIDPIE